MALERWREGRTTEADLVHTARTIGAHLARAHVRAGRADPGLGSGAAIGADLDGRLTILQDEIAAHAQADLDRLIDDHRRFAELRLAHGPWLGADRLAETTWIP